MNNSCPLSYARFVQALVPAYTQLRSYRLETHKLSAVPIYEDHIDLHTDVISSVKLLVFRHQS
jgi:hypothetical protein